jgi:hypothetical protein
MVRWLVLGVLVGLLGVFGLLVELPVADSLTPFVHLVAGGLLLITLAWALRGRPGLALALTATAVVLLEPAQGLLTVGRSPDPLDALGGLLGAFLGLLAWHLGGLGRRGKAPLT